MPSQTFYLGNAGQWLDRPGAPVLDVDWRVVGGNASPWVEIAIGQRGELYQLRLEIAVDSNGTSELHTVELAERKATYLLDAPGLPTGGRVDPNHRPLLWDPDYGVKPGS